MQENWAGTMPSSLPVNVPPSALQALTSHVRTVEMKGTAGTSSSILKSAQGGIPPASKASVLDWDENVRQAKVAFRKYEKGNPYWDKVQSSFSLSHLPL